MSSSGGTIGTQFVVADPILRVSAPPDSPLRSRARTLIYRAFCVRCVANLRARRISPGVEWLLRGGDAVIE